MFWSTSPRAFCTSRQRTMGAVEAPGKVALGYGRSEIKEQSATKEGEKAGGLTMISPPLCDQKGAIWR